MSLFGSGVGRAAGGGSLQLPGSHRLSAVRGLVARRPRRDLDRREGLHLAGVESLQTRVYKAA